MSSHFAKDLIANLRHHYHALVDTLHARKPPPGPDPQGEARFLHGHEGLHDLPSPGQDDLFRVPHRAHHAHHPAAPSPAQQRRASHAQANRAFEAAIQQAERQYAATVRFEPIDIDQDGVAVTVGFKVVSVLDDARRQAGQLPILFASADGSASYDKPLVSARTPVCGLPAAGRRGAVQCANAVRKHGVQLPPAPHGQVIRNLKLGSNGPSIEQCAALASKGSGPNGAPLEYLIAAPNAGLHISTVQRELGKYAGIVVAETAPPLH